AVRRAPGADHQDPDPLVDDGPEVPGALPGVHRPRHPGGGRDHAGVDGRGRPPGNRARPQAPAAARSSVLMSIFTICIMAFIARSDFALSLDISSLGSWSGMICQETPNLSVTQPHWISLPPPLSSLRQRASVSFWSLQCT